MSGSKSELFRRLTTVLLIAVIAGLAGCEKGAVVGTRAPTSPNASDPATSATDTSPAADEAGTVQTADGASGAESKTATPQQKIEEGQDSKAAASTQPDEPATPNRSEDDPQSDGNRNQKGPGQADPDLELGPRNPFMHRVKIPDFPQDLEWLNVGGPLRNQDLKGKFVLLDFWTYCCINCMHILPELKKLEKEYPNELVVIGVHSAKFETEKGTKNIEEAILRYEIEHPVVNDADHKIWDSFGVRSWPTAILIDPEGFAVWGRSGEFKFDEVDEVLKVGIPHYREKKTLDETPIRFELAAAKQAATPLRFPGKIFADEANSRLFIADSNHNRIVVCGLDGKLQFTIGSGAIGRADGDFQTATFDHPQGMVLQGETLYVADTENHMLRKVDLAGKKVITVAGTGAQGKGWPGIETLGATDSPPDRWIGKPIETELNSPWDLWIHQDELYIAMAGPHQIWKMPLNETEIGPFAGNGREDIVDGPLLPRIPYNQGYASFAQPSGLSSDGEWLYVADSEGSSIRAVPFDPTKEVRTVVGTAELPFNRLFHFGDKDGPREEALLQHCLAVTYVDGQLFVADTYNNKIKVVDPKTGSVKTLVGTGKAGYDDATGEFDEPAGLAWAKGTLYVADTNNHQIRTVDPATGKVGTLAIAGLQPVKKQDAPRKLDLSRATKIPVKEVKTSPKDGKISLSVKVTLPSGWKMNPQASMRYWVEADGEKGPVDRTKLSDTKVDPPSTTFTASVPVSGMGRDNVRLVLVCYYCQESGQGLCKVGTLVWEVPILVEGDKNPSEVPLTYSVPE